MKWYKKQLDALMKKDKSAKPDDKKSPGHFTGLQKKSRRTRVSSGLEKRSRNKTDLP